MFNKLKYFGMTALMAVIMVLPAKAQINDDYNQDYGSPDHIVKIDRYLDAEVWTNHTDNEFYVGDNIVLNFRTNRDAFVAIYSIDTKGRVNLLFPANQYDDNFVEGGVTYRLPDHNDDFDFVVSGPEGVETIQIIASKERFPIPDWYPTSGIVMDADDRNDFADYINSRYFVRYDGQHFAFDRSSIYVNEWEDYYYHPVYYPDYPNWTVAGNIYIDYPYGASVYINGIYWGITPLYIPRIYVGWHTFTIYDHYGYCWEHDIHITRYNTVVLGRNIVHTSPTIRSKYKQVRDVGYRNPVSNGYPKFDRKKMITVENSYKGTRSGDKKIVASKYDPPTKKRYVRGTTEVVKTNRGYETTGKTFEYDKRTTNSSQYDRNSEKNRYNSSNDSNYKRSTGKSTVERGKYESSKRQSTSKSGEYKRSTGSKSSKSTDKRTKTYEKQNAKKESKSANRQKSSSVKKNDSRKSNDASKGKSSGKSKDSNPKKSSGDKKKR